MITKEQYEAHQAAQDFQNEDFLSTLEEEERRKFYAVASAEKILKDAGILYFLAPKLRCPSGIDGVWYFHNVNLALYAQGETPTPETVKRTSEFMEEAMAAWFCFCLTSLNGMREQPPEERLQYFSNFVGYAVTKSRERQDKAFKSKNEP